MWTHQPRGPALPPRKGTALSGGGSANRPRRDLEGDRSPPGSEVVLETPHFWSTVSDEQGLGFWGIQAPPAPTAAGVSEKRPACPAEWLAERRGLPPSLRAGVSPGPASGEETQTFPREEAFGPTPISPHGNPLGPSY